MPARYLGHSAFVFEDDAGARILIDPFGNPADGARWFVKPFPPLEVDLAAVTHDHFDHNAVGALPPGTEVMSGAGERRVGAMRITGVEDVHSGQAGENGMANVIYVIDHNNVRYCHLGDNRHDLPDGVRGLLGKVDVLMVGVDDSSHLMSHENVGELVKSLAPSVVIPMHYLVEGLTSAGSTLGGMERWARSQGRRRPLRQSAIRIDRRGMPYEREVWLVPAELRG